MKEVSPQMKPIIHQGLGIVIYLFNRITGGRTNEGKGPKDHKMGAAANTLGLIGLFILFI